MPVGWIMTSSWRKERQDGHNELYTCGKASRTFEIEIPESNYVQ